MRVVVIWRDESEHGRSVREWLHELEHRTGRSVESYSPDEPDGESICRSYDVRIYPTILSAFLKEKQRSIIQMRNQH